MINTQIILYHNVSKKSKRSLQEFDNLTLGQLDNLAIWELDEGNGYEQRNIDYSFNLCHDLSKIVVEIVGIQTRELRTLDEIRQMTLGDLRIKTLDEVRYKSNKQPDFSIEITRRGDC